ncbi:AAA family ATPase, partial [bacterium]|nr:AAA family ATPase [bacterium]
GLNNLKDISMSEKYGDIVGYTQQELEDNFSDWIEITAQKKSMSKQELLDKIKKYYDGFSFNGITKVYNPFSVLNFFDEGEFYNYWYDSASPSFLAKYLQKYKIKDPKEFIQKKVSINFTNSKEIENASVESFLYQAGYLTISEKKENIIILDYPNEEVAISMTQLALDNFYKITDYMSIGDELWEATENSNMKKVVDIFNEALKPIPYDDYSNRNEYWYRGLFMMLLKATRILAFPEVHTFDGRSDIVIPYDDFIIIIEFKFAENDKEVDKKRIEGQEQVKRYAESYLNLNKQIITAVFIANDEKRQVSL